MAVTVPAVAANLQQRFRRERGFPVGWGASVASVSKPRGRPVPGHLEASAGPRQQSCPSCSWRWAGSKQILIGNDRLEVSSTSMVQAADVHNAWSVWMVSGP